LARQFAIQAFQASDPKSYGDLQKILCFAYWLSFHRLRLMITLSQLVSSALELATASVAFVVEYVLVLIADPHIDATNAVEKITADRAIQQLILRVVLMRAKVRIVKGQFTFGAIVAGSSVEAHAVPNLSLAFCYELHCAEWATHSESPSSWVTCEE
jgi:hypothetical protein